MDTQLNAQKLGLSDGQNQELGTALSSLGSMQKQWLDDWSGRSDFNYLKKDIVTVILESARAITAYRSNNPASLISLLLQSIDSPSYDFGRFALPLVLDLQQLMRKDQISASPEVQGAVDRVMIKCITDLPDDGITEAIRHRLTKFAKAVDLVHELKRRFVIDDGAAIDNWGKDYLQALENNEEVIGSQSISVDGQALPPFIKNWIKDYLSTVTAGPIGRGSLAQAQYFSKSANVVKLTIEDKRILQEALQLYDWLLSPSGSFAELEAYESSAGKDSMAKAAPPPVVAPLNAPAAKNFKTTQAVSPPPLVAPFKAVIASNDLLAKRAPPPIAAPLSTVTPPPVPAPFKAAPASNFIQKTQFSVSPPPPPRPPPPPPDSMAKAQPQPVAAPAPRPTLNPVNIQDVLLDRKRLSRQIYPASQSSQQSSLASRPQVSPKPLDAPGAEVQPQAPPDVEAKLAALRSKMQNNQQ